MSRFSMLGVLLVCLPMAAWAQEEGAGQPVRIIITKLDCSRLVRHLPAADVAYQPGVDAKGRAVAPADLDGSGADALPNLLPDVLEFPITINPVGYGARNQAQRQKAAAAQGISGSFDSKTAAQAKITSLNSEKTALTAKAATLSSEKAAADTAYTNARATLAALQADVNAGTRAKSDRDYVRAKWAVDEKAQAVAAKQTEVSANNAALTANASAIATQQAIMDDAPNKAAKYSAAESAADAKLAQLSSKGMDGTTMKLGTVRYDMAKGVFTFNDQPIGGTEQQELARACQKQGVR